MPGAAHDDGSGVLSRVYAINSSGQAAGYYAYYNTSGNAQTAALLYTGGSTTNLENGTFYNTVADGINSAGVVVGKGMQSGSIDPTDHAFVWDSVHGMQPLLPGNPSFVDAYGINNNGLVVGAQSSIAFVYQIGAAAPTNLGVLGTGNSSAAYAISNAEQIVGTSTIDSAGTSHAFLYSPAGGMLDLNSPQIVGLLGDWTLTSAQAISSDGKYIVGQATSAAGPSHGFLAPAGAGGRRQPRRQGRYQ